MSRIPSIGETPQLADVFTTFPASIKPLLEYHDKILRDPSPLTVAERELIAAYVSALNACSFCFGAHRIIAESAGIDSALFDQLMEDIDSSTIDQKLKPILKYVKTLTLEPANCRDRQTRAIREAGWSDEAIFHAVSVCALFNFMNRLVEGMGVESSEAVRADQRRRNNDIATHRYLDYGRQLGIIDD